MKRNVIFRIFRRLFDTVFWPLEAPSSFSALNGDTEKYRIFRDLLKCADLSKNTKMLKTFYRLLVTVVTEEHVSLTLVTIFFIITTSIFHYLSTLLSSNVFNIRFYLSSAIVRHTTLKLVCTTAVAASSRRTIPVPHHLTDDLTPSCIPTALSLPFFYRFGRQQLSRSFSFPDSPVSA